MDSLRLMMLGVEFCVCVDVRQRWVLWGKVKGRTEKIVRVLIPENWQQLLMKLLSFKFVERMGS